MFEKDPSKHKPNDPTRKQHFSHYKKANETYGRFSDSSWKRIAVQLITVGNEAVPEYHRSYPFKYKRILLYTICYSLYYVIQKSARENSIFFNFFLLIFISCISYLMLKSFISCWIKRKSSTLAEKKKKLFKLPSSAICFFIPFKQ